MMARLQNFALPRLYVASQYAVGAQRVRKMCIDELGPRSGQRLLDVGCGPAYYRDWLPNDITYFGFDTDVRAIAWAKERFAGRGTFIAETYGAAHADQYGPFDGILLMGLLHHLDDAQANNLLALCARSLKPGGRAISLDTCYDPRMSRTATWLAGKDQGEYVRQSHEFTLLAERHFGGVRTRLVGDHGTILTAQFLMVLEAPRTAAAATRRS